MGMLLPRYAHKGHRHQKSRWKGLLSWRLLVLAVGLWYLRSIRIDRATKNAILPAIARNAQRPLNRPVANARSLGFESGQAEDTGSNQFDEETDEIREPIWLSRESANGESSLGSSGDSQVKEEPTTQTPISDTTRPTWASSSSVGLNKAFPDYSQYAALVQRADTLPDLVMIPFENAVGSDVLQGWEYEWVSDATFNVKKWGQMNEPKIDFIYTWVNGSQEAFQKTKRPYEENSTLNDPAGEWLARHGSNRYRDWNEFLFSLRSLEAHAPFRNNVQVLVNAVMNDEHEAFTKQIPAWMSKRAIESGEIQVLAQEDFFEESKHGCLPTFNSLTMENQIHNTPSDVDMAFALSDDMLLGKPHAASDIWSPLYGPMIGFKTNSYNTVSKPTTADAQRFGEKPWLIYTSWMLNRRFGTRKRKGMAHFGHAISRRVMAEAMRSFPGPELKGACSRFRGDFMFQLYSWYVTFHYTLERHREVLLWSYLMVRADLDGDGYLSWMERERVLVDITEGHGNESTSSFRARNFYLLPDMLEDIGLEPPAVNFDILWTSLDGPVMIKDLECFDFDINECLAPGFNVHLDTEGTQNPTFSTATMFDRVSRQNPKCGDCLIKILLHRVRKGLEPLMPDRATQDKEYEIVTKALMRYQYVVHDPDGLFVMVTDTEQVETTLIKRFKRKEKRVGQLCLNDDVTTEDEMELRELQAALNDMYTQLFPKPSSYEDIIP